MLSMIPRDMKTYMSYDTLSKSNDCSVFSNMGPPEVLNSLKISRLPNHCLERKIGAPVILLRNLNQLIGLYNGTQLVVTKKIELFKLK